MKRSFTIKVNVPKRTGHAPHRSGSGVHGDRRLKRLKTRSNIVRSAISEYK